MLTQIMKTIWNQRKRNVRIALELLLIFCFVWYMVDYFFVLAYNKSLPSHRDNRNTYLLQMATYSPLHPSYSEHEASPQAGLANFRRTVDRLREHPDIESIAIAIDYSGFPETGSKSDTEYRAAGDTTRIARAQFIRFVPGEDYFRVFRHTADNGRKAISVAAYNWDDPSAVLVNRMLEEALFPGQSAVGKVIERTYVQPGSSRNQYRVIGVIDDTKRNPYLRPNATLFRTERLSEENFAGAPIAFRTKGNQPPAQFIPTFKKEMSSKLQAGNYYLQNVSAFTDMATEFDYRMGITNAIRLRTVLMVFFLVNIFLCVLGAFRHRVTARRGEIGIRRALGSDARGAGRLFILEGLLLLTMIVPVAMLIEYQFVFAGVIDTMGASELSYGDYLPDHTSLRFLITNALTWLIMAAMVFVGIWRPARSATQLKPVEALRDE
jgi:putative ABC transport system permease protein